MIAPRVSGIFAVSTRVGWVRRWYEGLGWRSAREDDVFVPYPLGGMAFSLWSLGSAAPNVAAVVAAQGDFPGTLLCTVVDAPDDVGSTLDGVARAGGRVVVADHEVPFGRSGWFLDPAGTAWEVAWIEGRSSAVPFAGAPEPDAIPAALAGVMVGAEDPSGVEAFYAEGLGWADRRGDAGGNPSLALDGGSFFLVPASRVPGLSSGPVPVMRPHPDVSADEVADRFVRAGAAQVPGPDDIGATGSASWVADPFGLHWVIAGS